MADSLVAVSADHPSALQASASPLRLSVVIPAHNCAPLLRLCLESVVGQLSYRSDAEIVVIDDGSTDNPKSVVDEVGRGIVRYERNPEALGAVPNFNRCIAAANGELIHLLHADDFVAPGFYRSLEAAFATESVVAAFCRTQHVDEDGNPVSTTRRYVAGGGVWREALDALTTSNRIATPSIVVRSSAYERAGSFDASLPHAADWDMWVRLASIGEIYFVDRVLAHYRVHDGSDTASRLRTGANMNERFDALTRVVQHLPADDRKAALRRGAMMSATHAGRRAWQAAVKLDWDVAAVQAGWAARSVRRAIMGPEVADPDL